MPGMVTKGEIEATNVPGFFLTKVPELGVQTIPYLFEGLEHARRFPRSQAADYLAAKIENAYGAACRQPDGSWRRCSSSSPRTGLRRRVAVYSGSGWRFG